LTVNANLQNGQSYGVQDLRARSQG